MIYSLKNILCLSSNCTEETDRVNEKSLTDNCGEEGKKLTMEVLLNDTKLRPCRGLTGSSYQTQLCFGEHEEGSWRLDKEDGCSYTKTSRTSEHPANSRHYLRRLGIRLEIF